MTWLVDAVIAVLALETLALAAWRRPLLRALAPQLAAGAALVLALRAVLADAGMPVVAACLALAGVAHGAGIWRDWAGSAKPRQASRSDT